MGTTPSTTNSAAKTVDEIIQVAIYDVAVAAFKAFAVAEAPWLKLPIISQLFSLIVDSFAGSLYKFLAQSATFEIIDLQTDSELNAYTKAEAALRAVHLTGNEAAINAAAINFKTTLASLIHFDGSATV